MNLKARDFNGIANIALAQQAVGQLTSTANVAHNLRQRQLLVKKAATVGAKVNSTFA